MFGGTSIGPEMSFARIEPAAFPLRKGATERPAE